jgi:hypothetical protein
MDECTEWELNDLVDLLPYNNRASWEQARLNAYVTAQVNSRKKLEMQDICKFKWEEKDEDLFIQEHNYEISNEDIERLMNLSSSKWQTK